MSYNQLIKQLGKEFSVCIDFKLTATENKRTFKIINKSGIEVCRVKIDNCLLRDHAISRCDYLFKICNTSISKYILIELKGTDVVHAVEQLISTLRYLKPLVENNPKRYEGYIISSSVPRGTEQKFRQIKERTMKNNGLKIIKKHFHCEIEI